MISDEKGRQLHDRFTRGESLTTREKQQLEEWYGRQDQLESEILKSDDAGGIANLESQIKTTLLQINIASKRIKKVTEENEALRREAARLRKKLAQQIIPQMV